MSWLNSFSKEEIEEMVQDASVAFNTSVISEVEFVMTLQKLGYNATDIADMVKFYTPPAPEEEDDHRGG